VLWGLSMRRLITSFVLVTILNGCELYVEDRSHPPPTTTTVEYVYEDYYEPDVCTPNYSTPWGYDYCTEITNGECSCVVFIDFYDYECREEYCFYWDTCAWEYHNAWCEY